jgi:hypothetical protein
MKKLIGLALIPALMIGCQSKDESNQSIVTDRKSSRIETCINQLKFKLKDPDSMKITVDPDVFVIDGKETVFFLYNAKNSYGGYVGDKNFYCKFDSSGKIAEVMQFFD